MAHTRTVDQELSAIALTEADGQITAIWSTLLQHRNHARINLKLGLLRNEPSNTGIKIRFGNVLLIVLQQLKQMFIILSSKLTLTVEVTRR